MYLEGQPWLAAAAAAAAAANAGSIALGDEDLHRAGVQYGTGRYKNGSSTAATTANSTFLPNLPHNLIPGMNTNMQAYSGQLMSRESNSPSGKSSTTTTTSSSTAPDKVDFRSSSQAISGGGPQSHQDYTIAV